MSCARVTLTVKWYNTRKRYGFGHSANVGCDMYIPEAALQTLQLDALDSGDQIEAEFVDDNNGRCPRVYRIISYKPASEVSQSPAVMLRNLVEMGTVKFFNGSYGFIRTSEGDVFVHISAVVAAGLQTLEGGQKVTFMLGKARDGREMATELSVVTDVEKAHPGLTDLSDRVEWVPPSKRRVTRQKRRRSGDSRSEYAGAEMSV